MTPANLSETLTPRGRRVLDLARICRLASAGPKAPHVAPFCPAFDGESTIYIETQPTRLTVRNLAHSDQVVVLVDDYVEDWTRFWMLSLVGKARTLTEGPEFEKAVRLLRTKFPQFDAQSLKIHFVLAVDLLRMRH